MQRVLFQHLKRWGRNSDGVTAIEFAMIGPLLLTLIFSILELSWLIIKVLLIDNAVEVASKQIYIGNVPDRAAFEALVCDNIPVFNNCIDRINVEAIEISDFGDVPASNPECRDSGEDSFAPTTTYTTGTSSAIVFLRVCVTAPLATPGLGFGAALPKQPDGSFAIVSSTIFMNEPF